MSDQHQEEQHKDQTEQLIADPTQPSSTTQSVQDLQNQIETLKAQVEEHLNGWKRAMADLANYKKQTEEEKKSWATFSLMNSVTQFLPILDHLNSALAVKPAPDQVDGPFKQFLIGLEQIKKEFDSVLSRMGVSEVSGLNAEFDPMVHESVSKDGEVTGKGKLIVSNVLTKGYVLNDQLMRPARVVVKEV